MLIPDPPLPGTVMYNVYVAAQHKNILKKISFDWLKSKDRYAAQNNQHEALYKKNQNMSTVITDLIGTLQF